MAHADYNCCLICDKKMEYNAFDPTTKEQVCNSCMEMLWDKGYKFLNQEQLKEKLSKLTYGKALQLLYEISYNPCYYPNEIDNYLIERKLITTKSKDGKWGKRLRNDTETKKLI